jgi:hypothetical protein
MRNVSHGHVGECGNGAAVIRVTGQARHTGFFLQLVSVQCGWIFLLGSHIRVALHTTISHRRLLPEKGMAGRTPPTQISVGSDTSQDCSRLGIEGTWTEKYTPTDQPHPDHNEYR